MPSRSTCQIREVPFDDRDALRLLEAYFDELRDRIGSYDPPSLDDLRADAERGVTLVAAEDGAPVACASLRKIDATTAEVKRMFVAAEARGRGHAKRLLLALEEKARALGCERVVLDTAAPLHEAIAMYEHAGYVEIARYNDNPVAARWFEKMLA